MPPPCRNPYCTRHCEPRSSAYRGKQGYCARCYYRWRNNGFPSGGPPATRRTRVGTVSVTLEDYAWLRSQGVSRDEATARVGVVRTTAWKYERLLAGIAGHADPGLVAEATGRPVVSHQRREEAAA